MDQKRYRRMISWWSLAGFFFIAVVGQRLHYLYDTLPGTVTAAIGPVNESTWEHLKLFYYPALLFLMLEWIFVGRKVHNLWLGVAGGMYFMVIFTIVFYTLIVGLIGHHVLAVSISLFVLAIAGGQVVVYLAMRRAELPAGWRWAGVAALLLFGVLMVAFTFAPPHVNFLFGDPLGGFYGLPGGG